MYYCALYLGALQHILPKFLVSYDLVCFGVQFPCELSLKKIL